MDHRDTIEYQRDQSRGVSVMFGLIAAVFVSNAVQLAVKEKPNYTFASGELVWAAGAALASRGARRDQLLRQHFIDARDAQPQLPARFQAPSRFENTREF